MKNEYDSVVDSLDGFPRRNEVQMDTWRRYVGQALRWVTTVAAAVSLVPLSAIGGCAVSKDEDLSVREHTIFRNRRPPLQRRFAALRLMHTRRRGTSDAQRARETGLCPMTARVFATELRQATLATTALATLIGSKLNCYSIIYTYVRRTVPQSAAGQLAGLVRATALGASEHYSRACIGVLRQRNYRHRQRYAREFVEQWGVGSKSGSIQPKALQIKAA